MTNSPQTTQVDFSHMTKDDLMLLRRHLRAMLIMVEQLLRFPLTSAPHSDKG